MKIKCDYCGNTYEDTLNNCPNCGAPNVSQNKNDKKPRTIEELKKWYEDRKLPPYETTRFFIGINYTKPKAFGIYKDDNGEFVVYKNKDTGERAIRYKGRDEAYAVNELYLKLKEEIIHQKNLNEVKRQGGRVVSSNETGELTTATLFQKMLVVVLMFLVFSLVISFLAKIFNYERPTGYYQYNDKYYYVDGYDDWYYYDGYYDTWYNYDSTSPDIVAIREDYDSYLTTKEWDSSYQFSDVKGSSDYTINQDSHQSSYDSDYDWGGSDSWDSGGTDWGSDW